MEEIAVKVKSPSSIRGLIDLISPKQRVKEPRRIRKVREIYSYGKISRFFFDIAFRTMLNFGNWMTSVALGLRGGYLAFDASRNQFRERAILEPPVFITRAQARRDLETLTLEGEVKLER